jgi:hypothetical protein
MYVCMCLELCLNNFDITWWAYVGTNSTPVNKISCDTEVWLQRYRYLNCAWVSDVNYTVDVVL